MEDKTNELLEITYKTSGGSGVIKLKCCDPDFEETLRLLEQNLANTHATDIVYTRRAIRQDDFAEA